MNVLLDTQVALWSVAGHPKLSKSAVEILTSGDRRFFVSVASLWEIAIKNALGRGEHGRLTLTAEDAVREFQAAGFDFLDVTAAHAVAIATLPSVHTDPFDRLIVAQAACEPMYLMTADRKLTAYGSFVWLV